MAHVHMVGTGAMLLATGVRRSAALRTLVVDGNNIKQGGARALMQVSSAVSLTKLPAACSRFPCRLLSGTRRVQLVREEGRDASS